MMTDQCDACGNAKLHEYMRLEPQYIELSVPVEDENTWEQFAFNLCTECSRKLVDWVEEMDETETRVDMAGLDNTIRGLEDQSQKFQDMADELRDLRTE